MPIFISTKKATLKNAKNKYMFTSSNQALNEEELIDMITKESGLKTKEDAAKAYYAIKSTMIKLLKQGYRVPVFFGDFYIAAKGTAATEDEPFTPTFTKAHDHHFELRFSPGIKKQDAIFDNVKYLRQRNPVKKAFEPKIKHVNFINGTTMLIEGSALNYDIMDINCGMFIKNESHSYRLSGSNVGSKGFYATLCEDIIDGEYRIYFTNHRKNCNENITVDTPYSLLIGDNTIIRHYYNDKKL